jgi:NADH:ubiquinone oxidoreductase subunit 6 (subunit J)
LLESDAVPLIGALPAAITSPPIVLFIYAVLVLMVVSAVTSVMVRNTLWAIGSFASTMALLALLYLAIAPFLVFAVQLLVYTTISAGLLLGLLRRTSGLDRTLDSPFNRQWLAGAAVCAALLALIGVVVGATSWPVRVSGGAVGLGDALTTSYVVGVATVVVVLAASALGLGLLLATPRPATPRGGGSTTTASDLRRGGRARGGKR